MDYLLKFENSVSPCWVDFSIDGDQGRTTIRREATLFETENLARENRHQLEMKYRRKLTIEPYDTEISLAEQALNKTTDVNALALNEGL